MIANVVVSTTRAVVELLSGDAAIRLRNAREAPALVQLWVDLGDIASIPDTSDAPFELTPSLFVLDAGQTQAVQLHYDGEPLPDHNERLYWINLLDVPAREHTDERSSNDAAQNTLGDVLRTRLKVLLRLATAPGNALTAPEQLIWKRERDSAPARTLLATTNPTAFHVSCAQVIARGPEGQEKSLGRQTFAPGDTVRFTLAPPSAADTPTPASNPPHPSRADNVAPDKTASSEWNEAVCHAINDFGSLGTFRGVVQSEDSSQQPDAAP